MGPMVYFPTLIVDLYGKGNIPNVPWIRHGLLKSPFFFVKEVGSFKERDISSDAGSSQKRTINLHGVVLVGMIFHPFYVGIHHHPNHHYLWKLFPSITQAILRKVV